MKKYFYIILILSVFSSYTEANPKGRLLNCWLLFMEKKPSTISEELNNSDVTIRSTISPYTGYYIGNEIHPYLMTVPTKSSLREGEISYSFTYIPPKSRREKGIIALSFRADISSNKNYYDYRHWIHWDTNVKKPNLSESTVKALFNKVYENTYGISLDWMIQHEVIYDIVSYGVRNNLTHSNLYDALNFNSLLFKDIGNKLRQLIAQVIQPSDQETREPQGTHLFLNPKMTSLMRRIVLGSRSIEEVQSLPAEIVSNLKLEDVLSLYDTPEKKQNLDMSVLSPEMNVTLLSEHRTWREAVTLNQIQQLDVSINGIQYIFAPTFKHFVWEPKSEVINIDTLSDTQIMSMDRDTFLRDVFLTGDLYVQGHVPLNVQSFMLSRKIAIKELGYEAVMAGSLNKNVHDYILKRLGFDTDFENMTPQQRRELFKKEIELMTEIRQQIDIIEDLPVVAAAVSHITSHPESLAEIPSP